MTRKDVPGEIYLIHLDKPIGNLANKYGSARHYTGWASNLDARLAEHAAGRGSKLMAAVQAAGIGWHVARKWTGTRARERQLKIQGGASRRCPDCKVEKEQQAMKDKQPTAERSAVEKTTVGELITSMNNGTVGRDQVKAAIADLAVIHRGAEVDQPQPEIECVPIEHEDVDYEIGA